MRCSLFPTTTDERSSFHHECGTCLTAVVCSVLLPEHSRQPSPHMRPHGLCSRHICRSAVPSRECAMMTARRREVTTLHAVESWGRQHTGRSIRACSSRRPHDMSRSITTLQAGHAQAGDARDAQADRARGAQGRSWDAALCVRRSCLEAPQSERRRVQSFLTQVLSKCEQTT